MDVTAEALERLESSNLWKGQRSAKWHSAVFSSKETKNIKKNIKTKDIKTR